MSIKKFEHLKTAFIDRFIQPSILRFKSAKEIFANKQGIDETVAGWLLRGHIHRASENITKNNVKYNRQSTM